MACSRTVTLSLSAAGLALGVGCEQLIGADFGQVQVVSCTHVAPPPPPDVQGAGGSSSLTFALYSVDLGDTNDANGVPGYRSIGFDQDGVCTNETQGPSCRPVPWANGDPTDGFDGRDNGIGRVSFDETPEFGSAPISSQSLTAGTQAGTLAPMAIFRVRGYDLRVDDDQVDVDWYAPQALGALGAVPAWNGNDVWPITEGTLSPEAGPVVPDAGNDLYPASIYRDPAAYVHNYTVVAHMPDAVISLSNVALHVEKIVVTMTLAVNPLRVVKGTLAGRLRVTELFTRLPSLTEQFGVGAICLGDPSYPRLKQYFCSNAEILADGRVDPSTYCDAISFAVAFEGSAVLLGPTVPVSSSPLCPPATDPANDDCSSSSAGPIADASDEIPPANCVPPGTPNNEKGLGGYCQTNADCVSGESICSAAFGAPLGAWFCTKLCAMDTECGSNEYCAHDPRGIACVPLVCAPADAGSDGATDAPAEADAHDASAG